MRTEKKPIYFRLFPEAIYVPGPVGGAIYLLLAKRLFALDVRHNRLLTAVDANSIEDAAKNCGFTFRDARNFLNGLRDLGGITGMDTQS